MDKLVSGVAEKSYCLFSSEHLMHVGRLDEPTLQTPSLVMLLNLDLKTALILTGYLPDVHEPTHEAGVSEEQLKHLVSADVEDLV